RRAARPVGARPALVPRHPILSGVLFGTAFAARLWPPVLGPLMLLWLWRNDGRRPALTWLGASVATAAVWFVPVAVIAPAGLAHSFHEQLARPLQLESLGSSILIAVHHVFDTPLGVTSSFGSQNLIGSGLHTVRTV